MYTFVSSQLSRPAMVKTFESTTTSSEIKPGPAYRIDQTRGQVLLR